MKKLGLSPKAIILFCLKSAQGQKAKMEAIPGCPALALASTTKIFYYVLLHYYTALLALQALRVKQTTNMNIIIYLINTDHKT